MINPRLFFALFFVNFLITLGFGVCDVFLPVHIYDLGARGLLLGFSVIGYAAAKIILSPLMGALSDRYGATYLIRVSLLIYLLVAVTYCASESLPVLIVARVFQGIACALFRPVLVSMIVLLCHKSQRATSMGTFDISFYAALAIGPAVGGAIKDSFGFDVVLIALVVVVLLAIVTITFSLRREQPQFSASSLKGAHDVRSVLSMCRGMLLGLLIFIFGRACGIGICATFLPIYLNELNTLSALQIGIVMGCSSFVFVILLRPMGKLADNSSRTGIVIVGGLCSAMGYFLIPEVTNFASVLCVMLGIGVFSVLSQPACGAMLAAEGERYGIGQAVGLFHVALNLGFIVGPVMAGLLFNQFGGDVVFYLAGAIGITTGFAFLFCTHSPAWNHSEKSLKASAQMEVTSTNPFCRS